MPSTRSQAGVDTPAGEAAEVAEALEEAAAELSAEIAARKEGGCAVEDLAPVVVHASGVTLSPPPTAVCFIGEDEV